MDGMTNTISFNSPRQPRRCYAGDTVDYNKLTTQNIAAAITTGLTLSEPPPAAEFYAVAVLTLARS